MKSLTIILFIVIAVMPDWRQYDAQPVEITIEHELTYEKDTVLIKHYHKVGNKFYILTSNNNELWVDNIKLLRKGSK